jgi:hypothetical protein
VKLYVFRWDFRELGNGFLEEGYQTDKGREKYGLLNLNGAENSLGAS